MLYQFPSLGQGGLVLYSPRTPSSAERKPGLHAGRWDQSPSAQIFPSDLRHRRALGEGRQTPLIVDHDPQDKLIGTKTMVRLSPG